MTNRRQAQSWQLRTWASLMLCCLLILGGCARGKTFSVGVDGLALPAAETPAVQLCTIHPMDETVASDDLQFLEFSGQVEQALRFRGIRTVPEAEAQCVIALRYDITGPEVHSETVWRDDPFWMHDRSLFRGRNISRSFDRNYGPVTTTTVFYTRSIELVARELRHTSDAKNETGRQLWKINAISLGGSQDLRAIFPIMLFAMQPYIGQDTGGLLEIRIADAPDGKLELIDVH